MGAAATHFMFNRVTGEKLVIDDRMYNTLMVHSPYLRSRWRSRLRSYFHFIFPLTTSSLQGCKVFSYRK